jgi:hypothetical protein
MPPEDDPLENARLEEQQTVASVVLVPVESLDAEMQQHASVVVAHVTVERVLNYLDDCPDEVIAKHHSNLAVA